jgi:hypothetical protein
LPIFEVFRESALLTRSLFSHAAKSGISEAAQKLAPVTALNGKTPDAIIAEYNKLDTSFRRQAGTAIAEARSLKEVNDYNERWLRRNAELEAMLHKHDGLGGAMDIVGSLARDKEVLEVCSPLRNGRPKDSKRQLSN